MRDLIRHFNDFQSKYRDQRRKEINPTTLITRHGMEIKIPITIYDPKNLKRAIPEPIQEACFSVRPMSKKQIYKLDRAGIMADAKAFNTKDPDSIKSYKPYGKNTRSERMGNALLRRFQSGVLQTRTMTVREWNALKNMGIALQ